MSVQRGHIIDPKSGTACSEGNWLPGILPEYFNFQAAKPLVHKQASRVARDALQDRYAEKLVVNPDLSRALVSFQSNKSTPFYRWLKYKEAFSHEFALHVLKSFSPPTNKHRYVLDPFAGAGTTLTTAAKEGWRATGIELLPVGTAAIKARLVADVVDIRAFETEVSRLAKLVFSDHCPAEYSFSHLRITANAFPERTERALGGVMARLKRVSDENVRYLLWFAALSVLEDVSYTRKDGQYLRWDSRSERNLRSDFCKGPILDFQTALLAKLAVMRADLRQRNGGSFSQHVKIIEASCLDALPKLAKDRFHLVLTSPPYCNRYDYTRTYALELAFLNYDEVAVNKLRQTLLSATVENKTKRELLAHAYAKRGRSDEYNAAVMEFDRQDALQEVLGILRRARDRKELNNSNIPTMVENYFFETNFVIRELARVTAPGGRVVMVNDNVQYHGEEVPVDLILSDFAEAAGLVVDAIWVLSRGKGNSSQQMGAHGRNELRKCVYVWSKPRT